LTQVIREKIKYKYFIWYFDRLIGEKLGTCKNWLRK